MSSFATSWAWKQKTKPAARKFVLVALSEFADSEGICRVSQMELAELTDQTDRTVREHLSGLEAEGLISRAAVYDEHGYRDIDAVQLLAPRIERKRYKKAAPDSIPDRLPEESSAGQTLPEDSSAGQTLPEESSASTGRLPEESSGQERSFIPYEIKDLSNNNLHGTPSPAGVPAGDVGESKTETAQGLADNEQGPPSEQQAPHGATSDEALETSHSRALSKNGDQDGENVNVNGSQTVPPGPPSAYRAALDAVSAAELRAVWRDWVRTGSLKQVAQEAQIIVWHGWIQAGHVQALRDNALDIIQSGSFSHPWGALRARMTKLAAQHIAEQAVQARPQMKPGQTVRYPDGSTAVVIDIRARGVTTDHPDFPDVPLGRVKTLEVLP